MAFTHLHVHSIYSTFDGMIRIEDLFKRAQELGMEGVALTDHGRMYGGPGIPVLCSSNGEFLMTLYTQLNHTANILKKPFCSVFFE